METYVVLKKPGERAQLVPAPVPVDLSFLKNLVNGYIELLPTAQLVSDSLRELTLVVNEEGKLRGLAENLKFEFDTVVGPLVALLTDENGEDHGLCKEHAEAVAKALDHYGVGIKAGAN